MRVSDWLRRFFAKYRKRKATAEDVAVLSEVVKALAASEMALTNRLDILSKLHGDLVRQVGGQNAALTKQVSDLRGIVAQLGEKAKEKPAAARSMADVRRFVGDDDA